MTVQRGGTPSFMAPAMAATSPLTCCSLRMRVQRNWAREPSTIPTLPPTPVPHLWVREGERGVELGDGTVRTVVNGEVVDMDGGGGGGGQRRDGAGRPHITGHHKVLALRREEDNEEGEAEWSTQSSELVSVRAAPSEHQQLKEGRYKVRILGGGEGGQRRLIVHHPRAVDRGDADRLAGLPIPPLPRAS